MQDNSEFNQGVIWACARLNEMHDQPTMAADVLLEARIPNSDFKLACEYDLEYLRGKDQRLENLPKGEE